MKNKKPDFEKMWKNIKDRIDHPEIYFIEQQLTGKWLADYPGKKVMLTIDPDLAVAFKGKDGKALANLFLFLNQEIGSLKDFIVTEHLFL